MGMDDWMDEQLSSVFTQSGQSALKCQPFAKTHICLCQRTHMQRRISESEHFFGYQ